MYVYTQTVDCMFMVNILLYYWEHILNQKSVVLSTEISYNNGITFAVFCNLLLNNCLIFCNFRALGYSPINAFCFGVLKEKEMRPVIISFFIDHQFTIIH